jgi:hypothetical protein
VDDGIPERVAVVLASRHPQLYPAL